MTWLSRMLAFDMNTTWPTYLRLEIVLCVALSWAPASSATDCVETVVIDSVEHKVTALWCGQALDSLQIAKSEALVQLPQEQTFEEYRIYVLPEVRNAFVRMAEAARKDSINLVVDSGWRSLSFQRRLIKRRMAAGDSFDEVLNSVAPPGYSEHHTGRALDLCPSMASFAFTDTYRWLTKRASEFGFFETLPQDPSAPLTWESWHWTFQTEK